MSDTPAGDSIDDGPATPPGAFHLVGETVDLSVAQVAQAPPDLVALGHIMRALISRPNNVLKEELELTGGPHPTKCTRLTIHGSVVIDGSHRRALDREAARWQQVASLPDQ